MRIENWEPFEIDSCGYASLIDKLQHKQIKKVLLIVGDFLLNRRTKLEFEIEILVSLTNEVWIKNVCLFVMRA